jgi:prepilin-type N-terminal cleavage/methylation domain-containing protein
MSVKHLKQAGFTMPELIVAIVLLIGALIGAAFVLRVDPQMAAQDNAQRRIDLAAMARGLHAYQHAHSGALPDGILDKPVVIGNIDGELDLCAELVPAYMGDLPLDPTTGAKASNDTTTIVNKDGQPCSASNMRYSTAYTILKDSADGFTLGAPSSESGITLSLIFPATK